VLGPVGKLVRWLGPWSRAVPSRPVREERRLGDLRAYLYRPGHRRPIAAYLLAPGLHFLGPDDPRMDRFARVLAEAGFLTLAPFLSDHLALRASPDATRDLMAAFDDLEATTRREGLPPPSVFSISFGSNPSINLCGDPRYAARVRGLFVFGGYADFARCCLFAATGEVDGARRPYDPSNVPAVFLNVVGHFGLADDDQGAIAGAWRAMCRETWGRQHLQRHEAMRPIGERLASELPAHLRELYLQGCGLHPRTREVLLEALARAAPSLAFADPTAALRAITCPVAIAHGRDDGVIPYEEAVRLSTLLPQAKDHPHRLFLTGLFTHGTSRLPSPRVIATEVKTLLAMVRAMVDLPTGRLHGERQRG
jgi:pimeloyl-ACP methyl ester carboxylesterase